MNRKSLDYFRTVLLRQQNDLQSTEDSSTEATQTVGLDQTSVGRLSRMDDMQSQAMALESRRRRQIQLTRIEAALGRIEEEEFGYCASCDEPINRKRLEIDPANPFCVHCASTL